MTMIRILKYSLLLGVWLCSSFGWTQDLDHAVTRNRDARIVGGHLTSEGRLELYYNGSWGTVCDTTWHGNQKTADVVCRYLGFDGAIEAVTMAGFGEGTGSIILDDVHCRGNETSVFECPNSGTVSSNCDHSSDVGVRCKVITDPAAVRLLSGSTSFEGVVEYRINDEPGLICDPDWSENEANVTCRQLGYEYGQNEKPVSLGPLSGTIFYRDYRCDGTEQQIGDCMYSRVSSDVQCSPDHIAQVSCGQPKDYDLRMTGSDYSEQGRIEVFLDGEWGYMQSQMFFWQEEHDTLCRQLGYAGGIQRIDGIDYEGVFARSSRPILIDDLHCSDNSMKITECPTLSLRSHLSQSFHEEEISVICFPHDNVANHPIRLRDENGVINQDYGVIEIYHDGIWGPICDTVNSGINHQIVCEQLGHTNLTSAGRLMNLNGMYTSSLPVWFPEIRCSMRYALYEIEHQRLYECLHEPWGTPSDCTSGYYHWYNGPVLAAATCVPMSEVNPTVAIGQPDDGLTTINYTAATCVPMSEVNPTVAIGQPDDGLTAINYTGSGPEMRSNLGACWKVILIAIAITMPIQRS